MIKRVLFIIVCVTAFWCLFCMPGLAAPNVLTEEKGNTNSLFELKKPEEDISTFNDTYIIMGKALEGTVITVYEETDADKGEYEPMLIDDEEVSCEVGCSGYFAREITLKRAENEDMINRIAVYGEHEDKETGEKLYQVLQREITVKNASLKDVLINSVVKIEDFISKLFK